jgi:HSP20 family protein
MFDTVLARDVQKTLDHFRRSVDQLFGNVWGSGYRPASRSQGQETGSEEVFSPVIESGWNENELCLRAILPGVSEKDVQVNVQSNQLIVQGQRRTPENWTKGSYAQLAYGKFYAAITLPHGLNLDKLTCRLHDGVLDISIPMAEQMKPRQIPIQTDSGQKTITA